MLFRFDLRIAEHQTMPKKKSSVIAKLIGSLRFFENTLKRNRAGLRRRRQNAQKHSANKGKVCDSMSVASFPLQCKSIRKEKCVTQMSVASFPRPHGLQQLYMYKQKQTRFNAEAHNKLKRVKKHTTHCIHSFPLRSADR